MTINTTSGPRDAPREPARHARSHTLNTTRVVEEDLVYTDEPPEIAFVLPAGAWHAKFADGSAVPLVAFAALENGETYGVAVNERGGIDLFDNVEERDGFAKYEKKTSNEKGEN